MRDSRSGHTTGMTGNASRRGSLHKRGNKRNLIESRNRRHTRRPKLPLREVIVIVRVIATRRATIDDLTRAVRMSRATVYRLLAGCRRDLGIRIDCESRVLKLRGWGLLNGRRVLKQ